MRLQTLPVITELLSEAGGKFYSELEMETEDGSKDTGPRPPRLLQEDGHDYVYDDSTAAPVERLAVYAARSFNERNPEWLTNHLADDVRYVSDIIGGTLTGRDLVARYLERKMAQLVEHQSRWQVEARIGRKENDVWVCLEQTLGRASRPGFENWPVQWWFESDAAGRFKTIRSRDYFHGQTQPGGAHG
jgi:hypothetical protein